jgi:TatD DNase family protein
MTAAHCGTDRGIVKGFCGEVVKNMLIDSHVHLDVPAFDADRDAVIQRAREQGVEIMLEIAGSDVARGSLPAGMRLAEEHPFIYAAVGLHPHEASLYGGALEGELLEYARHKKVIGWGEIGLDYHYDHSPRDTQRRVFGRQLELALELKLPAIIHTREAEGDTIEILRESWAARGGDEIGGVIHCFTGTQWLAGAALEMGFSISFSGVVTFKKADELRSVARSVPADKLLVETDCPYLAPLPHRGKRNEPAFVRETAARLAELRGVSFEEMARVTGENFRRLFRLG